MSEFTDTPFQVGSLFIIDPLVTLPLLLIQALYRMRLTKYVLIRADAPWRAGQ